MNTFIADKQGNKIDFLEGQVQLNGLADGLTARYCSCDENTTHINEIPDWNSKEAIAKERKKRYEEELPDGDQMDVIWKALEAIAGGGGLPAEALDIISKRNKIKEDLPYEEVDNN